MTPAVDPPLDTPKGPDFFSTFMSYPRIVPRWVWTSARLLALGYTGVLIWYLAARPEEGLRLFWGLTIPALPLLLVVAPGFWRQVCPMAFLNHIPRRFGFSKMRTLPERWRNASFGIAVLSFVVAVSMRVPMLNDHGTVLAAGLLTALTLAFLGGLYFKGRSGWCGTFCPLGPIQRTYGQAPLVLVPNGLCDTCVGCQKNCYDLNPRAAIFADTYDDETRNASQRRLFMGLLPGLIFGYFLQGATQPYGTVTYLEILYGACCVSVGLYWILTSFLPIEPHRMSLVFGALALGAFYWFTGPGIVLTLARLAGVAAPVVAVALARGIGIVGALLLVRSGLTSEWHYRESRRDANARSAPTPTVSKPGTPDVTDRETGTTFRVGQDQSLLDAVQGAGLTISYGCRSGICGADAVAIWEGAENLEPPGAEELATLRRMGLEGKARLACVCRVTGPVTIDRDPKSGPAVSVPESPARDFALESGLSRVVIVGNGVAGMGVAEALRRQSPSVRIDVVTNEINHYYNRMAIGQLIHSSSGMDGLQMVTDDWFQSNRVDVHRNTVAASVNRRKKKVLLATGKVLPYDKLVLATGARAATPTPDFLGYSNAFVLRSADDALAIRTFAQAEGARRAAVIGGGVLGVEAADALRKLGLQVVLIQRSDRLMNAQLDADGAERLEYHLEGLGIQIALNATIVNFEGETRITSAWLDHGPRIQADIFVACLGITPNTHLAEAARLDIGRGIRVDDSMTTSDRDILAVGDVAETRHGPAGLWPIGAAQADAAVGAMFGQPKPFEPPHVVLKLKSSDIDLCAFGDPETMAGDEVITSAPSDEIYWRVIIRAGRIAGAMYVGPNGTSNSFNRNIEKARSLPRVRTQTIRAGLSGLGGL